jgi:hypothetical protein
MDRQNHKLTFEYVNYESIMFSRVAFVGIPPFVKGFTKNFVTVKKTFADVCYLRLDFESFTLAGPSVTTETSGGLCTDTLTVTVSNSLMFSCSHQAKTS